MVTPTGQTSYDGEYVSRSHITWEVLDNARKDLPALRKSMGEEAYEEQKLSLQDFLCLYFNSGAQCIKKGCNISPMGATHSLGGKKFKVRWALPGGGKSGGLRLAVVVYCQRKYVKIAGAWIRKDDPDDGDFEQAFSQA